MVKKQKYDNLYEIAESQAGYFTAQQARDVGFTWERLSENAASGKFNRIQHGIYRLSHFPGSRFEDLFIAWLSAGVKSVISHESALAVYELSDQLPSEIHVILPAGRKVIKSTRMRSVLKKLPGEKVSGLLQ